MPRADQVTSPPPLRRRLATAHPSILPSLVLRLLYSSSNRLLQSVGTFLVWSVKYPAGGQVDEETEKKGVQSSSNFLPHSLSSLVATKTRTFLVESSSSSSSLVKFSLWRTEFVICSCCCFHISPVARSPCTRPPPPIRSALG